MTGTKKNVQISEENGIVPLMAAASMHSSVVCFPSLMAAASMDS